MSTSTFRLASRTAAATTSPETKSAAIESPAGKPSAAAIEAGEHRERAGEIASEVERVREQRIAAVEARAAQRDHRARRVDREDERDRRERPPRRLDLELDDAGEPQDRDDRDDDADGDEEAGLGERGEVLRLPVAVRVAAIRGPHRDGDGEERQERSREVGSRMRSLGEQPEARAREPGDELDRDEETGGPDRDERGAPLRRHGRKATASADGRVERPAVGHALELVLAALLERDPRPGDEVAHRPRHEHLARLGERRRRARRCARRSRRSPSARRVTSPAWSPQRTSRPLRRTSSRICHAQRIARAGPSNVARMPSPAVSSSRPPRSASALPHACSKRSSSDAPAPVAELARVLGRADDVDEEHRREHAIRIVRLRSRAGDELLDRADEVRVRAGASGRRCPARRVAHRRMCSAR